MRWRPEFLLSLTLTLLCAAPARAEVSVNFGGKVQTDLRFRTETKAVGDFYQRLEARSGISRNENIFKLKLDAGAGDYTAVAELDFVLIGYARPLDGIGDLALREKLDPYRIEAHALYLEAVDFLTEGLDVRLGQQLVLWGKGDQFNPTNTINANDLEDPLLFGEQQANIMLRVDYTPGSTWTLSGVLVPIFKPALLPQSAALGPANLAQMPMTDAGLRYRLHTERAFTGQILGYPTVVSNAIPVLPELSLENMQAALRVAGALDALDIALSYYVGRSDIPQPYLNHTRLAKGEQCDPLADTRCIKGLLQTDVYLGYPRVHVAGLNLSGQVNALGWISRKIRPVGYRLELGVYFPQATSTIILQDRLDFGGALSQAAGEYSYNLGQPGEKVRPLVVEETPFAKWVVGLDYTFGQHVMLNAQWVHGMADEFGAGDWISEGWSVRGATVDTSDMQVGLCVIKRDACTDHHKFPTEILRPRIGDYLVLGLDVKLASEKLLLRLFTIWALNGVTEERWDQAANERVREHHSMFSDKGFSAVIYPELSYNFGHGLTLGAGALLMLGQDHTKFGDPAAGGSQVFTRARWQW